MFPLYIPHSFWLLWVWMVCICMGHMLDGHLLLSFSLSEYFIANVLRIVFAHELVFKTNRVIKHMHVFSCIVNYQDDSLD